jgi:ATP-dependent exoDNAse (exonuclease V) alpha subunit
MQFKLDSGRSVEFAVQSFPHLDHGYAVTSHSSQGQTAERVLIHVDTELGSNDLLNRRMAYVSVSRGQWDAQIFTNDREKLSQALSHDVSHKSAFQPQQEMLAAQQKIGGPSSERVLERSMGYGLGL